ncbi:NAD(P)-binding protein [Mycena galericulata]|nr:NAD(P)-binding protein [Mycena galericulata]
MPSLSTIRAFNAGFAPSYTPVAIFVGATSGIGRGMAEVFARHTKGNANIVLVGRNRAAAEAIIASFPKPSTPGVQHEFVECDVSLMKNVRRTTGELIARFPKVNFLALTPGVLNMDARNETEEGIDRKIALHYYGRWRFVRDLVPALEAAHKEGEDAKVMSVLTAGWGGPIDLDDLGLKKTFSVKNAAAANSTYNDIMINDFAARYPGISFVHSHPGLVATDLLKSSNSASLRIANTLLTPLILLFSDSVTTSGEHQLYTLLNAGPGALRTDGKGAEISPTERYYGSPEAMAKLWKHTEDATSG